MSDQVRVSFSFFSSFLFITFLERRWKLFLTAFLVSTAGVLDQFVTLHCFCRCSSLVVHIMKYFFVDFVFNFLSVALSLVLSPLCLDPPPSWMRSLLCLSIVWFWQCLGLTWGVLDWVTTTGRAKLKLLFDVTRSLFVSPLTQCYSVSIDVFFFIFTSVIHWFISSELLTTECLDC